ncbi:MAG: CHAT domain-containing protein [Pseudomonadota bacterium]
MDTMEFLRTMITSVGRGLLKTCRQGNLERVGRKGRAKTVHADPWTMVVLLAAAHLSSTLPAGAAGPDSPEALWKTGQKQIEKGLIPDAARTFQRMEGTCGNSDVCRATALFYLGRCRLEQSEFAAARSLLERAERIYAKLNKQEEIATIHYTKARIAAAQGNCREALADYRRSESCFTRHSRKTELFNVLCNTALVQAEVGDYNEAFDALRRAEQCISPGGEPGLRGDLANVAGIVHYQRQEYQKAEQSYDDALRSFGHSGNESKSGQVLNSLGKLFEATSEYEKASSCYGKALGLGMRIPNPRLEAYALNNLGELQYKLGDYSKAADYLAKADRIAKRIGLKSFEARVTGNIGAVYLGRAEYVQAEEHFRQSLQLATETGSAEAMGLAFHNIANLAKFRGAFNESLSYSGQAIDTARKIGNRRLESTALVRLGNLYEYFGIFDKALGEYDKAVTIQKEIGDRFFTGITLADIAGILVRRGEIPESRSHLLRAVDIRKEIGAPTTELLCKLALTFMEAQAYADQKDSSQQMSRLSQEPLMKPIPRNFARKAEVKNPIQTERVLFSEQSPKARRKKDLEEAKKYIDEAERELGAEAFADRLLLEYVKGRWLSYQRPDLAVAHFSRLRSQSRERGNRRFAFLANVGLGLSFEALNKVDDAALSFQEAIDFAEEIRKTLDPRMQRSFLHGEEILGIKHILPYEGLARVLLKRGDRTKSLEISELAKARAFADHLRFRVGKTHFGISRELVKGLESIETRMAANEKAIFACREKGTAMCGISELESEKNLLNRDFAKAKGNLAERSPLFHEMRFPRPLVLNKSAVSDKELIIEYLVTDSGVLIYAVKGKELKAVTFREVPRHELRSTIRRFLEPLRNWEGLDASESRNTHDIRTARRLFDLLLADVLPEDQIGYPVIIIPDDCLGSLPFEMLAVRVPGDGRGREEGNNPRDKNPVYFGDLYPISYYHSVTALTLARNLSKSRQAGGRILVVADPVFDASDERVSSAAGRKRKRILEEATPTLMTVQRESGLKWPRLPFTGRLADTARSLYGKRAEVYEGFRARKDMIFHDSLEDYAAVVMATHGYYGTDIPGIQEPTLALTMVDLPQGEDGYLRMAEVMDLRLNADIVALTACQTGVGEQLAGEGVVNLGRAFQYAGAKAVLMSVWSVAEEASVKLVESFLRHLKAGKQKAEALRLARRDVRADGYEHPFYWAAFILAGEVE